MCTHTRAHRRQTLTSTSCVAHKTRSGCTYTLLRCAYTYGAYGKKRSHADVAMRVVSCRRSCRSAYPSSNPPLWLTFVESAFSSFPVAPYHPRSCSKGEGNRLESLPLRATLVIIILMASRMSYRFGLYLITSFQALRWYYLKKITRAAVIIVYLIMYMILFIL